MRSLLLSLTLGLGTLGLTLGGANTVQAQSYRGSAYIGTSVPVRNYWRGGWRGRAFNPGYGYYRGYSPYNNWYGGYGRYYYPRVYGGYSPWGGYYRPYSRYYYRPGYYW